jgi:hypothetical protein
MSIIQPNDVGDATPGSWRPGLAICPVARDPLWDLFTPEVLEELRRQRSRNSTSMLAFRLQVLAAGDSGYNDRDLALRAYKSAWEAYVFAAFACGLLGGIHDVDLRARLTGIDDDNFRSAMSECLAVWYFAGHRGFHVRPRPKGQGNHVLEFLLIVPEGDINVEVKAPHRPTPIDYWRGDDSDLLEAALRLANRQFQPCDRNLLVLIPELPIPLFGHRTPIEKAFIGEAVVQIPIDERTGNQAGFERIFFKEVGNFKKRWPSNPRFTRVGAVLALEEYIEHACVKHRAIIVHNPHATHNLPRHLWAGIPEFRSNGVHWRWSDSDEC